MERELILSSYQRQKTNRWKKRDRRKRKELQKKRRNCERKDGESCNMAATNDSWKGKEQSADVCIWSSCSLNGSVAN